MELFLLSLIAAETTFLSAKHLLHVRTSKRQYIFVDTSVLIDGRIVAVAESGFIPGVLAIPRSVVGELQYLADNGDADKRSRARHGLDVIKQLQSITTIQTKIFADGTSAAEGVDNRLLSLAKKHQAMLCTIDYNLNKVAQVENIQVLNINELAQSVRLAYLPGERIEIELLQKGNDGHQGVGHLADGTMVVVEHAHQYIGTRVEVEFIRGIQTAAGKMMFAKLVSAPKENRGRARHEQPVAAKPAVKTTAAKPVQRSQKGRKPQEPTVTPAPTEKREKREQPRQQQQQRRRNNRPRTAEDSLVALANKD